MFLYPFGDFHSLNLGWFLLQFKDWTEKIQEYLDNGGGGAGIDNVARLMIAGQYSATFAYQKYGICRYNDKLWMANTDLPAGGEAWNAAHWDEITVGAGLSGLRISIDTLTNAINTLSADSIANNSNIPGAKIKNALNNIDVYLINLEKFVKGKNIAIFGDSFSDETLAESTGYSNVWVKTFRTMVEPLGATITNYANAGSGYVQAGDSGSIPTKLASADLTNIDTVILFAGLNDFRNGVNMSRPDNPAAYTFWNGLNTAASYLSGKNVFVITPFHTNEKHNSRAGYTLEFYRTVLASWAQYNGFMLINGTLVPQFGVGSSSFIGIHPKDDFAHIIAEYIFQKICNGGESFMSMFEYAVNSNISGVANITDARVSVFVTKDKVNIEITGTLTAGQTGVIPLDFCPIIGRNLRGNVISTQNLRQVNYSYSSGAPNSYNNPLPENVKITISSDSEANEAFVIVLEYTSAMLGRYTLYNHS